jgi:anti-sigma factor RsiW
MTGPDDLMLLNALADNELDAKTALELERRLAGDPALAAAYREIRALKSTVASLDRPIADERFHADLLGQLAGTAAPAKRPAAPLPDWLARAAALLTMAVVSSALTYWLVAPRGEIAEEGAVLAGHRRALLAASPIDVASSDRHVVRPWFDAKLGLAPQAPDLAAAGFPLVGGRVDIIADRAVPSLVYRHGAHLISVTAVPLALGTAATDPQMTTDGGFNVAHWRGNGFDTWAVSDLDAADLSAFVAALRRM